jgi:DNA repair protein RecN (Recombination protein N)
VSASFDLANNEGARAWLAEQSIEHDGEVQLRRVVSADGRSRAYVNGQSVPVQSLRALGEHLVDVHGQLEFQSLSRRDYQRSLLDESGGLAGDVAAARSAFHAWRKLDRERAEFEQRGRDREDRLELLGHFVSELEALDAKPGEAAQLAEERRRITGLGRLADGGRQVELLLAGDDGGATAAIARSHAVLKQLESLDPALHATGQLLEEANIACREAVSSLRRYMDSLEADPARQEWVESRLAALEAAARKHRIEVDELPDLRLRMTSELASLREASLSLAGLERNLAAALGAYEAAALRLSKSRRKAAEKLDAKVTALMQDLGMRGGVFSTRLETPAPPSRSEHGADEIEFLVSANPGQPPRPLAKTASGGELSRISLALQVSTLNAAHLPCLVFDEVDAGVGGAVAEMVGRQLRALAASGQVLCVTHLPQVASQAGRQVRVSKLTSGGQTRTALEALDGDARVDELARMLGGASITERAREHAREMLESASAGDRPRRANASSRGAGSSRARSGRAV